MPPNIRLLHGDALELLPTLPDSSVQAVVTDPPYASGGLTAQERARPPGTKYTQSGQKMTWETFAGDSMDQHAWAMFTYCWLSECYRIAQDGSPLVVFTDWRQLPLLTTLVQWSGWRWLGVAVWDKTEGCRPCRGRFAHQAEFVVWGAKGRFPLSRNAPVLPGVFRHAVERPGIKQHLTGKPLALMHDLLAIVEPGGTVLDPFAGSGTTLLAAKEHGLSGIGIEVSDHYRRVAEERLRINGG